MIWRIRPLHARIVILNLFSTKANSLFIRKRGLKTILRDALNAEEQEKVKGTLTAAEEAAETDGDKTIKIRRSKTSLFLWALNHFTI